MYNYHIGSSLLSSLYRKGIEISAKIIVMNCKDTMILIGKLNDNNGMELKQGMADNRLI